MRKYEQRLAPFGHYGNYSSGFGAPAKCLPSAAPTVVRPAQPNFRFDCAAGCPQVFPFACHVALRQAVLDASKLAANAALRLQSTPRLSATVNHFRSIFGHDPAQPLPWPGLKDSGIRFAVRFRAIEQALLR